MSPIIVYVDDAAHAALRLPSAAASMHMPQVHWVLVACAPRITHRVSKFVSNRSRENWRNKWAERLFAECTPLFAAQPGHTVSTVLARGPLPELLERLHAEHGVPCAVLDWRRPKIESADVAVAAPAGVRKLVGTLTGFGALWTVLAGETLAA
jgi:hypothetical protein